MHENDAYQLQDCGSLWDREIDWFSLYLHLAYFFKSKNLK